MILFIGLVKQINEALRTQWNNLILLFLLADWSFPLGVA
jgi:hypothetical protein